MYSHYSTNDPHFTPADSTTKRLEQIVNPDHVLCKEDIVWVLEFIKKKVADEDPMLLNLPQPRLLKNFYFFAEVAMILIHKKYNGEQEVDQLKKWIEEATYGLK